MNALARAHAHPSMLPVSIPTVFLAPGGALFFPSIEPQLEIPL